MQFRLSRSVQPPVQVVVVDADAPEGADAAAEALLSALREEEEAASAAAIAAATAASGPIFLRTRDVHGEVTTTEVFAVQAFDGLLGFLSSGHGDERETA